jgi:hypothetical protein
MVCFFGKRIAFLPSPMVARNALGSNSRLLLEAERRTFVSVSAGSRQPLWRLREMAAQGAAAGR